MSEIRVTPTEPEPTHHMSLSDGTSTLGIYLCDGAGQKNPRAVRRTPKQFTPLKTQSGAAKYSDFELPFASVAQDDWAGGRGEEDFERNTSRYFDGLRANTEHQGQLILGGQEHYGIGYRTQVVVMPGSTTWQALYGTTRYYSRAFTLATGFTISTIEMWIKKVGTPETLTVGLYTDSGGEPGVFLDTAQVTASAIPDTLAVLHSFSMGYTIGSGTYHLVIYGGSSDSASNHWEVGTDAAAAGHKAQVVDTWTVTTNAPYYRLLDADAPFTALFFEYKGQLYFATRPDSGAAGKVYMNGYTALADDNSLDKTRLMDSTYTQWNSAMAGSVVQIFDGAGVQEQRNWRAVTGGGSGYLTCSPAWNIDHEAIGKDATHYNVLGADIFFLVGTGAYPFQDVAVTGEMAWLSCGEDRSSYRPIYKLRQYSDHNVWTTYWSSESTLQASYLLAIPHPTLGYILWLARNNDTDESVTLTRAPAPRDHNQGLTVAAPYHSTTAAGFMKEQLISPLYSDSFDRANGALGNTDGAGHTVAYPFTSGGSGEAWTEFTGTWVILSAVAKASALAASKALAGFAPAGNNVIIRSKVTHDAGFAGVFVRRADDNNYIWCATDGAKLKLVKRVGGSDTVLFNNDITYVAGAVLEVKCNMTTFTITYNGAQIDTPQIIGDAGLQSGAGVGLYTTELANTFDNTYIYINPVTIAIAGSNSVNIEVPASFTTGLVCSDLVGAEDWRRYEKLLMFIKSDKGMAAGELQLLIDDSALCGSPIKVVDFPALAAGVTYGFRPLSTRQIDMEFDLSATTGADTVRSVGINLTIDPAQDVELYIRFDWLVPDVEMIPVGDSSDPITGLERYGDPETLWVMKQGSVWEVNNDIPVAIPLREMQAVKNSDNGRAHLVHDVYLYFSLLHGIERYFRQNVDDVGPNRDAGLPSNRQGIISHMVGYPGKIFAAIDGGASNYSSVLCYDGVGWHEVYRAPRVGLRIRRLHVQALPGDAQDRLWISQGSDVLWVPLPSTSFNPYYDTNYRYTHEAAITTAWFYCGLRDIVKMFKSVKLFTENLGANASIDLYYRTDNNTAWTKVATSFTLSPVQEIALSATNNVTGKRIQFRLVLKTISTSVTPKVVAMVLEVLERTPLKWQYTFQFNLADGLLELGERDPEDSTIRVENLVDILDGWLENLTSLTMRSVFSPYDSKTVMLETVSTEPSRVITDEQQEQHIAQATAIEI